MKNVNLLFNGTGDLMANVTLSSVLVCQANETGGEGSKEDLPSVEEFTEYPNWEKWLMHQMAAQRCAVSTPEDIQKPSVHCPGQPDVSGSVEQGSGT